MERWTCEDLVEVEGIQSKTGGLDHATTLFLRRLARELTSLAREYVKSEKVRTFPFNYGERQLEMFTALAARSIDGYPIAEHPINRRKGGRGRIDFWIAYRNMAIAIEAKAGSMQLKGKPTKRFLEQWTKGVEQTKSLSRESCKELCMPQEFLVRATIASVTLKTRSFGNTGVKGALPHQALEQATHNLVNGIPSEIRPKWAATWTLDEKCRRAAEDVAGVAFIAKVHPPSS